MFFERITLLAIALASLSSSALAENLTPNLQINGFATAGASTVTKDHGGRYLSSAFAPNDGIDNDGNFSNDNVLGIQLNYQLDERTDLVGQLVSSGRENYETHAEWAYLGYRVNDNLRLRAGRFALPIYMYSENIRVGQAYPWARLPTETYVTFVPSSNGMDALYRLPLGDWNLDAQAYTGRSAFSNSILSAEFKHQLGANLTLGNGSFSVRAGYNTGDVSIELDPSLLLPEIKDVKGSFTDLGMSYDDGRWFAAAEITQARTGGYAPDTDAGFISVGHYFGKWLPYVMFSKSNAVKGDECRSAFNATITATLTPFGLASYAPAFADAACRGQEREQTSYSAGFRYDVSKRTSLKLEVDHVTDFHNTPGLFGNLPTQPGPLGVPVPGTLTDDDSTNVITFNINATF